MGTVITYITPIVTIQMTGDGVYIGCTYDKLDNWYGVDEVDDSMEPRPNAPGAFAPVQTFPDSKLISVEGQYFGSSRADALQMREDLALLYNGGEEIVMMVADDLRITSRRVFVKSVTFPWTIHPEFTFSIDARAADPRRYSDAVNISTPLAAAGTGLSFPIIFPIDFGTIGVTGRMTISNNGNTETMPVFVISGGDMPDGFIVVNVETGERITYVGPLTADSTITLDTQMRAAIINDGGAGSRFLAAPEWFTIPARSSVEVQFLSRGAVSGTPTLTASTAPAFY